MPISRKDFESGNFVTRHCRDKHPVFLFLKKNRSSAFTVSEISKSTEMQEETIRSILRMLEKDGLVEHKTPHYILKEKKKSKKKKR